MATTRFNVAIATRQGTLTSPFWDVPTGYTKIRMQADIAPASWIPENSFSMAIQVRVGAQWVENGAFTWVGEPYTNRLGVVNPPPAKVLDPALYGGKRVRFKLTIPNAMGLGGSIVTEP